MRKMHNNLNMCAKVKGIRMSEKKYILYEEECDMEEMSIKEAAKKLNVEAHVLRYWEDELKLDIKRNSMGHRYYDERDIRMFQEVQELKTKGFTLKDIRLGIDRQKTGNPAADAQDTAEIVEEKAEDGSKRAAGPDDALKQEDTGVKVVDFKLAQMQTAMNKIVANALRENKDIITTSIKSEITADVMRQFDTVMREKEEREEERFRKLDEVLRQMQRANEEVAATKVKRRFGRKR